jgi:transcriptional regulator GlxA family with amidase domain
MGEVAGRVGWCAGDILDISVGTSAVAAGNGLGQFTEHRSVLGISRELSHPAPGQQTVLDRLLDVLLVMAMRASFEQSSTAPRSYHAASDPRLGRALQAMHEKPERAWTVAEIAHLSAMSRPSFARNFERALGQSPMQYLADWRLTLARDHLLAGELTLEQIAHRTGYGSPNAFAAAFRRHVGLAPGEWRQRHSSKPSIPG